LIYVQYMHALQYLCADMETLQQEKNRRQVANWLLIGVGMIVVQVVLGGITRLTESGLSITEWKPITGVLPPMNDAAWQVEFDKYRTTDQFKYVHQHFSLSEFKYIFFWEWFHRVWARLIGVVFLFGFVYFLVRRKFRSNMILPLIFLFLLGGLQGAVGWIMVKSGLVPDRFYVGHIELSIHFMAALILLAFTLWFALKLLPSFQSKQAIGSSMQVLVFLTVLLFVQLIYGGFMAGLKAGATAPTWPDINGAMIPAGMNEIEPASHNLFRNIITIQFIHRLLAYLLCLTVIYFFWRTRNMPGHQWFSRLRMGLLILVSVQVLLGILTVLGSTNPDALLWLGVWHQFTAMLIVMAVVTLLFISRRKSPVPAV